MSFIPYQVDYSIANTAKTLGFSKKKVTFKFGFASQEALRQGSTGAQCRGSEHEVNFVWSLKTGKRQLFLDNKDVHFSESGQNGWTTDRAWQHVFHIRDASGSYRCHFVSQPKNPDLPDSKPFDLRINGVSYFGFNQIFKLGTPAMVVREARSRGHHHSGRDSPMSPEERQAVAAAKVESLREFREQKEREARRQQGATAAQKEAQEGSLISFDDPPPSVSTSTQPTAANQFASELTLDSAIMDDPAAPSAAAGQWPTTGVTQASPYGPPPAYGQRPPAAAPVVPAQQPPSSSTALTPFSGAPGGGPSPYVDATGRVSMGQQPPAAAAPAPYSYGSPYSTTSQSNLSYGSAPSFAQPPQGTPPAQQPMQQTTSASSYFASPPPPQQNMPPAQQPMQQSVSMGPGYPQSAPPAVPMQQPMQQAVSTGSYAAAPPMPMQQPVQQMASTGSYHQSPYGAPPAQQPYPPTNAPAPAYPY